MRTSLGVILLLASTVAAAQELGTLFHTPKERAELERKRRGEPAERVAAPRPDPVLTGFVKRSDGKSTVFIDKRPYAAGAPGLQDALDPRIVERFEPLPPPPAEAVPPEVPSADPNGKARREAAPAKKAPPAPNKANDD